MVRTQQPLSYLQVVQARQAPAIDGAIDASWSDANVVHTGKVQSGDAAGATADVRTLWQNDTLYVLAVVTDPTIDVSSSNFPRLDLNPNTGEPIGRHTHQVVAEQAVHAGTVTLPVIP